MSYILDALRRADAERQRGGVPGLHAQTILPPRTGSAAPRRVVPLAWVLAGALLLLLGGAALAWLRFGERAAEVQAPGAAPALATPAPEATALPVPIAMAPPAVASAAVEPVPGGGLPRSASDPAAPGSEVPGTAATTGAPPDRSTAGRRDAAPAGAPAQAAMAASPSMPPPDRLPAVAAAAPASAAAIDTPAAAAAPMPSASRVTQFAELPESLRRQLPAITLGGGVYAEQATQRLVLVNGQVTREGDQLATDLQLVRILPRSVILSFRGQQFEMKL